MRIDMNIAALRNMIANVRVMVAVVRGNASRQLHSGSRKSRHRGIFGLSRRGDFCNPISLHSVARLLQTQGWQCFTMVEQKLYSPAVIKPATVTRASKTPTVTKAFRSY